MFLMGEDVRKFVFVSFFILFCVFLIFVNFNLYFLIVKNCDCEYNSFFELWSVFSELLILRIVVGIYDIFIVYIYYFDICIFYYVNLR